MLLHTEVLYGVVNAVNLVVHTKVQIPGLVHFYVPHPFFVTSTPLLHGILVHTLVHHVYCLDVAVRCGMGWKVFFTRSY